MLTQIEAVRKTLGMDNKRSVGEIHTKEARGLVDFLGQNLDIWNAKVVSALENSYWDETCMLEYPF